MTDRYAQLVNTPIGKLVTRQVGLPQPSRLERYDPGGPVIAGPVLLGAAGPGPSRLTAPAAKVLKAINADVLTAMDQDLRTAAAEAKLDAGVFNPEAAPGDQRFKALVFDATQIESSDELERAWAFFAPAIRRLDPSGRVIILGTPPEDCATPPLAIAQRALEGLERAIGKEVKRGATSQLVYVKPKAEAQLESTLRFLLSPRSAFVSGQVVRIGPAAAGAGKVDWDAPLAGKVALVTGAARGIGEQIARVLARDGATVVGLDVPQAADDLIRLSRELGGDYLTLDITAHDAPKRIAQHLRREHDGVDVVVHNAGITRDRRLANMDDARWNAVLDVNLVAPWRITAELVEQGLVHANGRIIAVASIAGIAGNVGQTNYAASKAGVIGLVDSLADDLPHGITVNAVAPGFIETAMTAAVPFATREVGRRLNAMSQAGQPVDVAETIAWFADPASTAVTGNVVRVCGQMMLGA
jgi:3-oxoacyl-[acyl-carrier protein] reductase